LSAGGLDLSFDDTQQAIADSVGQLCRDQCGDAVLKAAAGRFPAELWKGLADLGVLALATPEGEGGSVEVLAAMEALGRSVFPGPLAETFLATQLLPEAERAALASGSEIVSVGAPPLMPFAPVAGVFVEVDGDRAFLARPSGAIEPVSCLGGEPWGRLRLERGAELDGLERGMALHASALAGYLCAAGRRLVDDTAEHARTRRQFGRPIGEFQAVAHPLADCALQLDGAAVLARAAAFRIAVGDADAPPSAAAARLAACRAAVHAAHTCHQLFGAIGITLEGPVFHVSRRILQRAGGAPGAAAARETLLTRFGLQEATPCPRDRPST
jgi:alkylation response protein AidB-like acyl-CoA dehydrogenase